MSTTRSNAIAFGGKETVLLNAFRLMLLVFFGIVMARSRAEESEGETIVVKPPEWPTRVIAVEQPPAILPSFQVNPLPEFLNSPEYRTSPPDELALRSTSFDPLMRSSGSRSNRRLATVPHMFGDYFDLDPQFASEGEYEGTVVADLPLAAGGRVKLAENNSAAAMDRVFLLYQHFHNALQFTAGPGSVTPPVDGNVDRFVVGLEKTLWEGNVSVDFRIPVYSSYGFPGPPFGIYDGGNVGNLTITPKFMLFSSDTEVFSAGMGVNTPTGADTHFTSAGNQFTVHNDAVHLLPFIAFTTAPDEIAFFQLFAQLDLATNGNAVEVTDPFFGTVAPAGIFTEQNLFHLDFMGGHWLWRDLESQLTGVAVLLELHYTSTLQDTDIIAARTSASNLALLNTGNRLDVINLTSGLQLQFTDTTAVRIGGVFPLRDDDNRFFDSEINLQINRRF